MSSPVFVRTQIVYSKSLNVRHPKTSSRPLLDFNKLHVTNENFKIVTPCVFYDTIDTEEPVATYYYEIGASGMT